MTKRDDRLCFEALILDEKGSSVIKSENNLLHSLLSNDGLWSDPSLNEARKSISDQGVELAVKRLTQDEGPESTFERAFLLRSEGTFDALEPLRHPLVKHLSHQGLGPLYILRDEISQSIACQLYPLVYEVENELRGYLMKFMTTRLGPRWWEMTAAGEWRQKVRQRKNNELVFGDYIDNNAYLIDFGDLGRMIYAQSSGFTNKDEIIEKIAALEETPEAVHEFKNQLKSNYHKFFKNSFKDQGFQEKWEELEKIRHKIAHNNLFVRADMDQGEKVSEELLHIISAASSSMDSLVIEEKEKEAIRQGYVAQGYLDIITEEKFLTELASQEQIARERDRFVGLSHFVKAHLGSLGYDHANSYALASRLEAQGKVEMYEMDNPYGDHPTTAIRSVEDNVDERV